MKASSKRGRSRQRSLNDQAGDELELMRQHLKDTSLSKRKVITPTATSGRGEPSLRTNAAQK